MVPARLSHRVALTAILAVAWISGPVAPIGAGPPERVADLEFTPTVVAPGGTIAVRGRCLANGTPTQVARVSALSRVEGPPAEDFSMAVVYSVDATGGYGGGFVVPSDARTLDWSMRVTCWSGDAGYGASEAALLTVAGDPGGLFAMDVQVAPGTIEAGDEMRVTGRCINDGVQMETAHLEVPGLWPDIFTPLVMVEAAVDTDGLFATELRYPLEGPTGQRAVVLTCRSGADVIAETAFAPFTITEAGEPIDPPDPPPAVPTPVPNVAFTG